MYDPILLTLDGSEPAERAIPHAAGLARCLGARLILLRVVPFSVARGDPYAQQRAALAVQSAVEEMVAVERREAEAYLKRVEQALSAAGVEVERVCRTGRIAPTILAVAQEYGAKLLVLATHGRSGPGCHAYGSVASDVLLRARVPVLLVRVAHPPDR
jgi:nucleotide-binding universal stress UspA family protein